MGRSYNGRHQSVASEKEDEQREKMGIIESVASERESGAVPVLNLVHTKLCIQRYPQQQQQSTRVSRENQFSCVSERRSCSCCVMRALSGDDAHSCLEPGLVLLQKRPQIDISKDRKRLDENKG